MKISVYSIEKSCSQSIQSLINDFISMSSRYATIKDIPIFNKQVALAQTQNVKIAQNSYLQAYEPYLSKGFCIALDVEGEALDSYQFSEILKNNNDVRFFIGGAYGFNRAFLQNNNKTISLGRLTYAHKIAKLVLFEQIYRGLCINNNHPYHKD